MGFIKDSFRAINSLVTLGGSEALIESREFYDGEYSRYKQLYEYLQSINDKINDNLHSLGKSLIQAKKTLKKSEIILKDSRAYLQLVTPTSQGVIEKVNNFNTSYDSVITVGFGGLVGGTTALGAWAVVSVLGSASTGTAIAGLSGIAATNATLAWFGGGALAAGGAGMSGGMIVLGGIIAVPMMYFATKRTYAKSEAVKKETEKLKEENEKLLNSRGVCESNLKEIKITVNKIVDLTENFTKTVEREYKVIRPYGPLSYLRQKVSFLFGMQVHCARSQKSMQNLEISTNQFLEAFRKAKG
jgi:membrane protein implicated in regulation of membrane protease activity